MRLCDRGEAIEFTSQPRKILRRSRLRLRGQGPDLQQYRGYRGVVIDQVLDRRGKVWPSIEQFSEHAVVFAHMMRCQGRAERQAVGLQPGFHVVILAEFPADPGELVSQVLVGLPQLPAKCYGSLAVVGGHGDVVPFVPRLHA